MPDVDFLVRHDDRELPSADALAHPEDLEAGRSWDLEGALVVRGEDVELRLEDTLVPLAQSVLDALLVLARTGHATMQNTTEYGYLRLDVEGAWIRVGGDGHPAGRVERDPLIHGLLRAVGRLADLLAALGLHGFDRDALVEDRREVVKALAAPGWTEEGPASLPPPGEPAPREDAEGPVLFDATAPAWTCDGLTVRLPGPAAAWAPLLAERVRPALEAGRSVVVPFPHAYGYARFDVEGPSVRVSGDGMADLRLPLEGVLRSL